MGKGVCPVLGTLLPILNADVSEGALVELVNARNIRVFDSVTGVQVTSRNYKNFLMRRTVGSAAQADAPIEPVKVSATPKVEKKKASTKKTTKEAPATVEAVPEVTPEEIPSEPVEAPVEETPVVEIVPEVTEEPVDTTIEETNEETESSTESESQESTYTSKKKKRR